MKIELHDWEIDGIRAGRITLVARRVRESGVPDSVSGLGKPFVPMVKVIQLGVLSHKDAEAMGLSVASQMPPIMNPKATDTDIDKLADVIARSMVRRKLGIDIDDTPWLWLVEVKRNE